MLHGQLPILHCYVINALLIFKSELELVRAKNFESFSQFLLLVDWGLCLQDTIFLGGCIKGDLDGTILSHAIFCSARCLRQEKIVYNSYHITLCVAAIVVEF